MAVDRSSEPPTFVWVEADETATGFSATPQLWTAPYATSPSALVPRKVATLDDPDMLGGQGLVSHDGVALTLSGACSAQLTRLSDGASVRASCVHPDRFSMPLWADSKEVWMLTAPESAGRGQTSGIVRFARAALPSF